MDFNHGQQLFNNALHKEMARLLLSCGPGHMSGNAYDTAWLARLRDADSSLAQKAITWLRENQLADGSWGAGEPVYHHDRAVCTLAALIALAENGRAEDLPRIDLGRQAFLHHLRYLGNDPAGETIAFEMIIPTLLLEAADLGVLSVTDNKNLVNMAQARELKLAKTPKGLIDRSVTMAFSSEMAGADGSHILDKGNLLEANGSVGHSPSATAYYLLRVAPDDQRALAYLQSVFTADSAPNVYPFDVFEPAWILWNLSLNTHLSGYLLALCQHHLDFLEQSWDAKYGIGHASGYTPRDGDDTGFVFELLHRFDRNVNQSALHYYEESTHFQCFALESNPSISTNVHALGALRQAGHKPRHPRVQKVLRFLKQTKTAEGFWFDKWHASPYYPTSHMIIACAGYHNSVIRDSIEWILSNQKEDGSWGFYASTAEETAYCIQALVAWHHAGQPVPFDRLEKAAGWLSSSLEQPYPPLWIGKCLYSPILVVKSAAISALLAVNHMQNQIQLPQLSRPQIPIGQFGSLTGD